MLKKISFLAAISLVLIALGVSSILAAPALAAKPAAAVLPTSTPCIPCPLCANPVACTTLTITNADNGKTISLKLGQSFLLALDTNHTWTVTLPSTGIVKRIGDGPKGTQGIYQAIGKGATDLTAIGNPLCLPLGCAQPSILFKVHLVVQ